MGRILLVDSDEHFLELARLSLEEKLGVEIVIASTAEEAVSILKKGIAFHLVISDYQKDVLNFLISRNSSIPFFYFTDEKRIEIPFTPTMFLGVFRKNQFEQLCKSVELVLKKSGRK